MTAPSAWRPLSEAPRIYAIRHIVRAKGHETVAEYNYLGWRMDSGKYIDETQWEYRAEVELDRAVQVKIAEAFGELLGFARFPARASHCIDRARNILHTSMGGRIPDEVP